MVKFLLNYTKNSMCYLDFTDNGIGFPINKEHLLEPYISRSKRLWIRFSCSKENYGRPQRKHRIKR